jgi:hypothetical protein
MSFEVLPRYSGGSPAAVDEHTARRVAEEERQSYLAALKGAYGDERAADARREGLDGIVLERHAKGNRVCYTDVITGRDYDDMPYGALRHPNELVLQTTKRYHIVWYRRDILIAQPDPKKAAMRWWSVVSALEEKYRLTYDDAKALWDKVRTA